jgi:hypothetical protein
MVTGFWGVISAIVAIGITIMILGMAAAVLLALFTGKIDLAYLLSESANPQSQQNAEAANVGAGEAADPNAPAGKPPETPKASLGRFQLLIFTFVIAGVYLILCLESGTFVEMPQNVVLLLGVSGGTYAASKGIKAATDTSAK